MSGTKDQLKINFYITMFLAVTEERLNVGKMRHTSTSGLLLLCLLFLLSLVSYFVNAASSSHYVQRRDTSPKYSGVVVTKMEVSPFLWYVSVGDTVEINCTTRADKGNNSDKMDLQLVWTKMTPGERTKKILVSQRASEDLSYVLSSITHEHQGVYTCSPNESLPNIYVHNWHHIIWVADASPKASIDLVSHNRNQFFHNETITLSCQLPDDNTQWKMMRFNFWEGNITECPNQVSADHHVSCTIRSGYPWGNHLYWCESPAGEKSNVINITFIVGNTVLESPPLPVLEGEDVMLRCLQRDKTTKNITSNFGSVLYKNDRGIRYSAEGTWTLTAVTKADEGFYKCSHPMTGPTIESWFAVKARPGDDLKEKSDITTS